MLFILFQNLLHGFFFYLDCCTESEETFTSVLRAVGVYSTVLSRCGLQTFTASHCSDVENEKWCCLITQPTVKV